MILSYIVLMKEVLFQYNPWWEDEFELKTVKDRSSYTRQLIDLIDSRSIIFLTGLRRVGKTTLMKLIIKYLIENGTGQENIFYVSLDDYTFGHSNILEIINEYRKIQKQSVDKKIYLFLDEIAYKQDFQQQLKNLYDNHNVKIFASSSSSSLLKDNKAFLTGRSITIEVQPLDYFEYLEFKEIKIKQKDSHLHDTYFREYIKHGGMPENVLNPDREYLVNLIDDIIMKDITAFYRIKNPQLIKDYFVLLMERSGKQVSINKISKILKISPETSNRYLNYFRETYLIHLLARYGKTNEKLLSPKKVYATDLGMKYLFVGERDIGSYFENYLFMKLIKKEVYYLYENGTELDFYTADKILIESKYYSQLNKKQEKLFSEYPAEKKIIIDSIMKLKKIEGI